MFLGTTAAVISFFWRWQRPGVFPMLLGTLRCRLPLGGFLRVLQTADEHTYDLLMNMTTRGLRKSSSFPYYFCFCRERKSRHDLYIYYIQFLVLWGAGDRASVANLNCCSLYWLRYERLFEYPEASTRVCISQCALGIYTFSVLVFYTAT